MGSIETSKLRIASASGAVTDRRHGFADLARSEDVQFIVGDWMSEYNMTTRGGAKVNSHSESSEFEPSFLEAIEPALEHIQRRHIRIAANAGASDTRKLYETLTNIITTKQLDLKVAYVEGDEVSETVQKAIKNGDNFRNLTTGKS